MMFVYIDDDEAVFVEQLTFDEARLVLARTRSELATAYNAAHAASLRMETAEVEDQLAWLETEQHEASLQDASVEHTSDLWADRQLDTLVAVAGRGRS